MSSRVEVSPHPRKQHTPGAFPSADDEPPSPTIISTQISLSQAVWERKAEYITSHTTRIKVGTWNVAALSGTTKDLGAWFVDGKGVSKELSGSNFSAGGAANARDIESPDAQEARRTKKASTVPKNDFSALPGGEEIGLYVLGLQEIVDITSAAEALRSYSDPQPTGKWKRAVEDALPKGYELVAEQQLIGLYLVIYASPSVAPLISSVSTSKVGTGLMGFGNKGGIAARIILGETTRMVFVNCHLAAGTEKGSLERRNWDSAQIQSRAKFEPIYNGGGVMEEFSESIGDEDFAFWFGDLNYRLESMPGDDVRRLLMVHTQKLFKDAVSHLSIGQTDSELSHRASSLSMLGREGLGLGDDRSSSPFIANGNDDSAPSFLIASDSGLVDQANDPASLQTTLSSLLPHDQLLLQMQTGKAFHEGWQEGSIQFLPTYKYDVGSIGEFDSSEKQRGPSWCDRILFRTRKHRLEYLQRVKEAEEVKRRDEELKKRGFDDSAIQNESVLFEYDPDVDGVHDEYDPDEDESKGSELVVTQAGFDVRLHLDNYSSHQRVLSSDHKPLDAVFTLTYDAVDPDLKMKVHQEVAREIDKAENEGRPTVTVVIDHSQDNKVNIESKADTQRFEGVNFGDVRYDCPKIRNITIANTGRVPATVGFVDRIVDQGSSGGVAPSWLKISFDRASDNRNDNPNALREYTLEPGDAANVELTLHVTDVSWVRKLNDRNESLEDVMVLRVRDGRDYFLPLRGVWLQSVMGRSLDELVRIPEGGVRQMQNSRLDVHSTETEGVKWSAPRELFRLTESIERLVERSIAEWGMKGKEDPLPWEEYLGWPFAHRAREQGNYKEKQNLKASIREGLDTESDFKLLFHPEGTSIDRLEAAAETLLEFVTNLEDGIITVEMWAAIEKQMLNREKMDPNRQTAEEERTWISELLSSAPVHSISFTFITSMLSRITNEITSSSTGPLESGREVTRSSKESTRSYRPEPPQKSPEQRREDCIGANAAIFAEAVIRGPSPLTTTTTTTREKERKASESRKKALIELFMQVD